MKCKDLNIPLCSWCLANFNSCYIRWWGELFIKNDKYEHYEKMFIARLTNLSVFQHNQDFYMLKAAELYNEDLFKIFTKLTKLKILI
jgi:hypothetical protein